MPIYRKKATLGRLQFAQASWNLTLKKWARPTNDSPRTKLRYDRTDESERERPPSNVERSWQRDVGRWGEFIINYGFDTIIEVREPDYENVCLSLCMLFLWECMLVFMHADFPKKKCFRLMGFDIYAIDEWHCCFIRLMLFKHFGSVNLRHEIYMYACVDCDYWWCWCLWQYW